MPELPKFQRRDFLRGGVIILAAYAVGKTATGVLARTPVVSRASLTNLSPKQAAIFEAAAVAIVGPQGLAALTAGLWDPAADFDALLGRMPAEQRGLVGIALHLFENARLGFRGFSRLAAAGQELHLEAWRTGDLALQRTTWGLLHAAACSSFSGGDAGWRAMGYPGPCMYSSAYPGRPPGQSALYTWDAKVP
jgi:hypothetical protein